MKQKFNLIALTTAVAALAFVPGLALLTTLGLATVTYVNFRRAGAPVPFNDAVAYAADTITDKLRKLAGLPKS